MYGVWHGAVVRGQRRPWAARITGLGGKYTFEREFLRGWFDYTHSKRGHLYFALPPGIYDVFEPLQGKKHYRAYLLVDKQGEVSEISKEEAIKCLKNMELVSTF